jgi:hypothetical protein
MSKSPITKEVLALLNAKKILEEYKRPRQAKNLD